MEIITPKQMVLGDVVTFDSEVNRQPFMTMIVTRIEEKGVILTRPHAHMNNSQLTIGFEELYVYKDSEKTWLRQSNAQYGGM